MVIAVLCLGVVPGVYAGGKIENGKKVAMDYVLTVEGKIVDRSQEGSPLAFIQGKGMIIPGLEKRIVGLSTGDRKTVQIPPQEAYGLPNPKAIQQIPRAQFPAGQTPKVGMMLQMSDPSGRKVPAAIVGVTGEAITLDFNHPLAGKTLTFDVKIVGVE